MLDVQGDVVAEHLVSSCGNSASVSNRGSTVFVLLLQSGLSCNCCHLFAGLIVVQYEMGVCVCVCCKLLLAHLLNTVPFCQNGPTRYALVEDKGAI